MFEIYPIPIAVVLVAGLIASVTDVWKFKVYNVLTLPLFAAGLAYHAVTGGAFALSGSLLGALVGFFVMIILYVMGGMGAGDVKFVAALGAWLGLPLTLYVFLAGSLAAGVYSVVLLVYADQFRETMLNMQLLWLRVACLGRHLGAEDRVEVEVARPDRRRRLIPFSAMMTVGLVATLLWLGSHARDLLVKTRPISITPSPTAAAAPGGEHLESPRNGR